MNILQHKYSDIQKETERKQGQQPQQNETENETNSKVAKVKFHRKLIENKVCIVAPKHALFLVQTLPCKKRTK